jgi:hypothetical protein
MMMFLRRKVRDYAIGVIGAYAVIGLGLFVTARLSSPPAAPGPAIRVEASAKAPTDCRSDLERRSESVC